MTIPDPLDPIATPRLAAGPAREPAARPGPAARVSRRRDLVFVSAGLELDGGGRAAAGRLLAAAVGEFARAEGLRLRVLTLGAAGAPGLEVPTRCFGGWQAGLAASAWGGQMRSPRPAFVFDFLGTARTQAWLPSFLRAPYLVVVYGIEVWRPLEWDRTHALELATVRLSISDYTLARARPFCPGLGTVDVVPLALEERSPTGEVDFATLGQAGQGFLLIVGRMAAGERYKGHDALIAAMPGLAAERPEARLVIAGDGDDRTRLEARARELGLGPDRVLFTGFLSETTLAELYRRCGALVMPSRGEGFGLVYLEAMRASKPCVAARGSAGEEVVVDGETGILIDPDDPAELAAALAGLLADPERARRLGEAGRRRWRRDFSVATYRERLRPHLEETDGALTMCGINGIVRLSPAAPPIDRAELLRTRDAMALRGPDGAGEWLSADGRAALGHRRLAILDPSPAGAQPMASADGRQVMILNGEIYNFRELRSELAADGHDFRSHSDTEVLLALWAREREAMLPRLRGMYTLAIWDEEGGGELLLARDPLGIKPLYYSESSEPDATLRFASQVKALERGGAVPAEVDPAGLAGFLLWGSVPEPWTIRRGVKALPAGCWLRVRGGRVEGPVPHYRFGQNVPAEPLAAAAAIDDSVRAHLVSDVPVAIFLSAGLDSSLIAALARRHLPEPPLTFTLRFDELRGTPFDEAPLAAETARRLGTRHVEGRVGREEFLGLWDEAMTAMDQPSIDGFNTFLVSRAAHAAGIKVVLSGLGGDEVFGSYPSFRDVPRSARLVRQARRLPGLAAAWPVAASRLAPGRPKLRGLVRHGGSLAGAYFLRRGLFLPEELPALLGEAAAGAGLAAYQPTDETVRSLAEANGKGGDPWTAVHLLETAHYLRNQLLRDADWAAMASSVELRVPFVDAWLREHLAAAGFEPARSHGKAALVRQAAPELPAALWERPKSGFYVPVMDWLDAGRPQGATGQPPLRMGADSRRLSRMGADSRRLAQRVLAGFGVELPGGPAA